MKSETVVKTVPENFIVYRVAKYPLEVQIGTGEGMYARFLGCVKFESEELAGNFLKAIKTKRVALLGDQVELAKQMPLGKV